MSRSIRQLNVQYRATLLVFGILLVLAVPAAYVLLYTERRDTIASYQQSGLVLASVILEHVKSDMQLNRQENIQKELIESVSRDGIVKEVSILSTAGSHVHFSSNSAQRGELVTSAATSQALEFGTPQFEDTLGGANVLLVVQPIQNQPECYRCHGPDAKILGAIKIGIDKGPLRAQLDRQLQLMLIIAGITLLVVGATLAVTLRGVVINPARKMVIDAEAERERQAQLYHTDRLASIGELASGVAHELNNPLTSIIGFSEMLAENQNLPPEVKGDLEIIQKEAKRTAEIVKNLLTFARRHSPAKQPVDINAALQNILSLRDYDHKVNNIEVITRLAPELPEVLGDNFQLQQVFMNIIINAEYFMKEAHGKGTLTITSEQRDGVARLSFSDDGPGIPEENLARIFDPFFTTKGVGKGTGLGLSICHGIVTKLDGRIWAESEPGKGSTFFVELPITKNANEDI